MQYDKTKLYELCPRDLVALVVSLKEEREALNAEYVAKCREVERLKAELREFYALSSRLVRNAL